ncbi:MAG: hypothetical protein ACFE94_11710 [Candidatus Hodarchaeota archaeon]
MTNIRFRTFDFESLKIEELSMDTMPFYFEIYNYQCRKHSTSEKKEDYKEKRIIEIINSNFYEEGKKSE